MSTEVIVTLCVAGFCVLYGVLLAILPRPKEEQARIVQSKQEKQNRSVESMFAQKGDMIGLDADGKLVNMTRLEQQRRANGEQP